MNFNRIARLLACGVGAGLGLPGCAFDVVSVKHSPAVISALGAQAPHLVLKNDASVAIGTGFPTKLKKGTTWQKVGTLPQGDVYSTRDQVLTVEASHIHEAQLVLSGTNVVGFYLPVEKAYTAATAPVAVTLESQP